MRDRFGVYYGKALASSPIAGNSLQIGLVGDTNAKSAQGTLTDQDGIGVREVIGLNLNSITHRADRPDGFAVPA